MQPFNSDIYRELEEVLQEVLVKDGELALPYFGSLQYCPTSIDYTKEHLVLNRHRVTFTSDANRTAKEDQIKTLADHLKLSEFESKVVLNRWLGSIKSDLRTKAMWSSQNFGEISSTSQGIQVVLADSPFTEDDHQYFGFSSVAIPQKLGIKDQITDKNIVSEEDTESSETKIIPIDSQKTSEGEDNEKVAVAKKTNQPVQTSARALAASFILGVITLSLFSFEGNRVGSPVYNMLHPVQQASQPLPVENIEAEPIENELVNPIPESSNDQSAPVNSETWEPTVKATTENATEKSRIEEEVVTEEGNSAIESINISEPEVYVVLGSFSQKENAYRAIKNFEELNLTQDIEYKYNGTYYRVGLSISENEWHQVNQKHSLPFWILQ